MKYRTKLYILSIFIPLGVLISYISWLLGNKVLILGGFIISLMGLSIPFFVLMDEED